MFTKKKTQDVILPIWNLPVICDFGPFLASREVVDISHFGRLFLKLQKTAKFHETALCCPFWRLLSALESKMEPKNFVHELLGPKKGQKRPYFLAFSKTERITRPSAYPCVGATWREKGRDEHH